MRLVIGSGTHAADFRGDVVPARGHHVVVGDDDGRRFQVASAGFSQTLNIVILHLGQIHAQKCQVVLANNTHQLIDFAGLHHAVVGGLIVDNGAAWVRKVTRQHFEIVFRKSLQQASHGMELAETI